MFYLCKATDIQLSNQIKNKKTALIIYLYNFQCFLKLNNFKFIYTELFFLIFGG